MLSHRSALHHPLALLAATAAAVALSAAWGPASASPPAPRSAAPGTAPLASRHLSISCEYSRLCPDIADSVRVYGEDEYVGHDEPSLGFYSNKPGSGNRVRYEVTLPRDPSPAHPTAPGKSYDFELHGALWFGMALCDTQSYPEQVSTCAPDSDRNIVDPAKSPKHPGTAFLELQLYPPGWVAMADLGRCRRGQHL